MLRLGDFAKVDMVASVLQVGRGPAAIDRDFLVNQMRQLLNGAIGQTDHPKERMIAVGVTINGLRMLRSFINIVTVPVLEAVGVVVALYMPVHFPHL